MGESQPPGVPDSGEQPDFDLDAASLRTDGTDIAVSIEVLASKLEQALPGRTRVERRGGGLLGRRSRSVKEVLVQLGSMSYRLEVHGDRVEGFRQRESGGIAIKRERLDPGSWVAELTATLRSEAERSAEARQALYLLLG